MIKVLAIAVAAVFLIPATFMAFLGGPQAATDVTNIVAACRTVLGVAPQPESTVAEFGGADAELVAAAPITTTTTTAGAEDPTVETTTTAPPPPPLLGAQAYDFVTSLNTIDNWRTLPVDELNRWARNPPVSPLPVGAHTLPPLPADQTNAAPAQYQPSGNYARACAAVVSRATKTEPSTPAIDAAPARRVPANLAGLEGAVTDALGLLRAVDPDATQADPRQFYLDYWPITQIRPGDIVLYDFTTAGAAHFGVAVSEQAMLTTGSCCTPARVQLWPIPTNASALSITQDSQPEHSAPQEDRQQ
ncbi:hypothetical protein H7I77_25155 [Mycolicibacterium novocastrense]|uniref:NlpC/P60 domain-containing protein n=1 Tax=Mycolicibacterium novocastrense TaxID=59813 RepID=A0AAW5SSQ0_MYCNV|nr:MULTISPECIES: hypothetical protein [Mycolicibacterium]MCV7026600.1 hypothetical protein [Mycolicibacterium novocastrense]MDX1887472.1 hypothetical protein [Mycolicibacterium sp. 120270]GAT07649.1 uncharacterized protein RMCN_0782 [Mycolicibacterium novocastrense]